jgi:anti-anti-sigma factor
MIEKPFANRVVVAATGEVVVSLRGGIDMSVAAELRAVLDEALALGGDVRVDLAEVELIDSSGLRELLRAQALAARRQRSFGVSEPTAIVRRVLEVADVAGLIVGEQRVAEAG